MSDTTDVSDEMLRLRAYAGPDPAGHIKARAMQLWFMARGAAGGGQFVGDPDDCRKQIEARGAFEA